VKAGSICRSQHRSKVPGFFHRLQYKQQRVFAQWEIRQKICLLFGHSNYAAGVLPYGNLVVYLPGNREQRFFRQTQFHYLFNRDEVFTEEKIPYPIPGPECKSDLLLTLYYKEALLSPFAWFLQGDKTFNLGIMMAGYELVHCGELFVEF